MAKYLSKSMKRNLNPADQASAASVVNLTMNKNSTRTQSASMNSRSVKNILSRPL
jgi:hypothetical protein